MQDTASSKMCFSSISEGMLTDDAVRFAMLAACQTAYYQWKTRMWFVDTLNLAHWVSKTFSVTI